MTNMDDRGLLSPEMKPKPTRMLAGVRLMVLGFAMLSPLALASCRVTSQAVTRSQNTPDDERLEIIYRAHPEAGTLFSSVPRSSPSGIVQASAEVPAGVAPFHSMSWAKAELRIECPHPDGRPDYARVTLHFAPVECGEECAAKSWAHQMEERVGVRQIRRATFRERWFYESPRNESAIETFAELDLPKAELDRILAEIASHGYFAEQRQPIDSESLLEVRLNRRWTSKRWSFEPTLDALVTRVYEQGTQSQAAERVDTSTQSAKLAPVTRYGRS
jgi:hypothetical protein